MGVWSAAVEEPHRTELSHRVSYAEVSLRAHAAAAAAYEDLDDETVSEDRPDPGRHPEEIIHLLCDLMHLSLDLGADFSALLGSAEHHFVEERLLR